MKDAFLQLWKDNYASNYDSNIFNSIRSKPLLWLKNNQHYFNIPIILVAAGPSLDKNIEYLRKAQKNFLIICADVILFKLVENDIHPDFVVTIDPSDSIIRFWKDLDTSDYIYVLPTTCNPALHSHWKGKFIWFNQVDDAEPKKSVLDKVTQPTRGYGGFLNRFFVGATMLQLSSLFTPSKVLLVGFDFGFTGNKAYVDGFLERKLIDVNNVGMDYLQHQELNSDLEIHTKWGIIPTTKLLNFYKNVFNHLVTASRLKIVNCTEGGIYLEVEQSSLQEQLSLHPGELIRKDVFKLQKRKKR